MYANLKVRVDDGGSHEVYAAYEVRIDERGATIYLDAQDGNGSYAEPNGELELPRGASFTITADF